MIISLCYRDALTTTGFSSSLMPDIHRTVGAFCCCQVEPRGLSNILLVGMLEIRGLGPRSLPPSSTDSCKLKEFFFSIHS